MFSKKTENDDQSLLAQLPKELIEEILSNFPMDYKIYANLSQTNKTMFNLIENTPNGKLARKANDMRPCSLRLWAQKNQNDICGLTAMSAGFATALISLYALGKGLFSTLPYPIISAYLLYEPGISEIAISSYFLGYHKANKIVGDFFNTTRKELDQVETVRYQIHKQR